MHTQPTIENLFITGASGFLGQSILKNLEVGAFKQIHALCRSRLPTELTNDKCINVIRASLAEVDKYKQYLTPGTTVIHCAAATGKCSKKDFFDVNTEGTRHILEASSEQGIRKFLHTSTVAVTFDDISHCSRSLFIGLIKIKNITCSGFKIILKNIRMIHMIW